jgi:hypothetical protein
MLQVSDAAVSVLKKEILHEGEPIREKPRRRFDCRRP